MSKCVKNCTFVLYPETGFELGKLEEHFRRSGYSACISPLHSPDSEENGEKKKHYHVIVALNSPRELKSLSEEFCGVCEGHSTACFNVGNMNSLNRYLTHEDNPEKQQFNEKPRTYGGYAYEKYVFKKLDSSDTSSIILRISEYMAKGARDYAALVLECTRDADYELVDWIINHAYAVNCILTSAKQSRKKGE